MKIEFNGGESRNVIKNGKVAACNYMIGYTADGTELYAEFICSDNNIYGEEEFDEYEGYEWLREEIVAQAKRLGIAEEELEF